MDERVWFSIIIGVIGIVSYIAFTLATQYKGDNLEKDKAIEPASIIDEGVVARIGIVSSDWGPTVHILLEEKPESPIALTFDTDHSIIPLTQMGDRVRIERGDENDDDYRFTNVTLGISVVSD